METRDRSMTERMKGAALLQVDVYEEVGLLLALLFGLPTLGA